MENDQFLPKNWNELADPTSATASALLPMRDTLSPIFKISSPTLLVEPGDSVFTVESDELFFPSQTVGQRSSIMGATTSGTTCSSTNKVNEKKRENIKKNKVAPHSSLPLLLQNKNQ